MPTDGPGADLPPAWRDHEDRPTTRPSPPTGAERPFYAEMMAFQGADYDRNAFAMGTAAEVAALRERLDLQAGTRVLDVGCATGRHLWAVARDPGCVAVGVDVAPALVEVARRGPSPGTAGSAGTADAAGTPEAADAAARAPRFAVGDARRLAAVPAVASVVADGGFDVAWSLCQGGFGTDVAGDRAVLAGMAAAVRPGGLVVLTAFHALFAVRHLVAGDAYDPVHGVHHQRTELRGPDHARRAFDLWTTTWTVRELGAAAAAAGLEVVEVVGCEPGRFDATTVRLADPELLLVARRPA